MKFELSTRAQQMLPSPTLAITAKAIELRVAGHDVISFSVGEPDFNTPTHVVEAAHQAMLAGKTRYTPAAGIPELKRAIAAKLKNDHGLEYENNQIVVTSGAKQALYNFFQVIINPGDEVIIPTPYWVSYPDQVKLAGGVPVFVEGKEENGFKITAEQLKAAITPNTKAMVINSPSNPTGAIYSREELVELGQVVCDDNLWVVSDEIYEKLIFDGEHVSIASLNSDLYERTIVINGVSKTYAMTGWRIGYAAGNAKVIKAMSDLSSQSTSNPTTVSQYATIAALEGDQSILDEMKAAFNERRNRVYTLLNEIPGFRCAKPQGAFYFYINIIEAMKNSGYENVDDWAEALLAEEKVALVPGSGFGTTEHIRISYATSLDVLEKGIKRIHRFVTKSS